MLSLSARAPDALAIVPLWVVAGFAYLTLHLGLYAIVLRHHSAFSRERTIFMYHLVSALACGAVAAVVVVARSDAESLALLVGLVSLHGIYSLSFLELWALADRGYSLQILRRLADWPSMTDIGALRAVGESKKAERIDGLIRLRLVEERSSQLALTRRGRAVALIFGSIAWLAGVRESG